MLVDADVSEKHAVSIFQGTSAGYILLSFRVRLTPHPDDGGSTHLWNVSQNQLDYMVLYLRRL
jgi:hypothetical protein